MFQVWVSSALNAIPISTNCRLLQLKRRMVHLAKSIAMSATNQGREKISKGDFNLDPE